MEIKARFSFDKLLTRKIGGRYSMSFYSNATQEILGT